MASMGAEAARRAGEFEIEGGEGSMATGDDDTFEDTVWTNPCREVENNRKRFYVELRKVLSEVFPVALRDDVLR